MVLTPASALSFADLLKPRVEKLRELSCRDEMEEMGPQTHPPCKVRILRHLFLQENMCAAALFCSLMRFNLQLCIRAQILEINQALDEWGFIFS